MEDFKLVELSKNSFGVTESVVTITLSFEKRPTIFKQLFELEINKFRTKLKQFCLFSVPFHICNEMA